VGLESPAADQAEAPAATQSIMERLPPKIHKIRESFDTWVQETGKKDKPKAMQAIALMQTLKGQMQAKNLVEAEQTADAVLKLMQEPTTAAGQTTAIPDQARMDLPHNLGSSFLVFRIPVQDDLKLSEEQKAKLEALLPEAMQVLQKLERLPPDERKQALRDYRPQAQKKLKAALSETLDDAQRARLRQLELQRDGLFEGENWQALNVTAEQRNQFMVEMRKTQTQTEELMQEVRKTGKRGEIRPKVVKLRQELQAKLESLLTEAQRTQWKEMLGQPIDPSALFDLTSQ